MILRWILIFAVWVSAQKFADSLVFLHVSSWPIGAQFSKDAPPEIHGAELLTAPATLTFPRLSDTVSLYFFKPGFRNTHIQVKLRNTANNFVFLRLQAETDSLALEAQTDFLQQLANQERGKLIMGSASIPAAIAAIFWYQASEAYRKANNAKAHAEQSILIGTSHYNDLTQTFKTQEHLGNTNQTNALIAVGISALVFATGITLYF